MNGSSAWEIVQSIVAEYGPVGRKFGVAFLQGCSHDVVPDDPALAEFHAAGKQHCDANDGGIES